MLFHLGWQSFSVSILKSKWADYRLPSLIDPAPPSTSLAITANTLMHRALFFRAGRRCGRSCLRTFDEITRWVGMNEDEQRAVNLRIALLADRLQHQSISITGTPLAWE